MPMRVVRRAYSLLKSTREYMNVPLVVLAWGKLNLTLDCRATIAAHAIATHACECALSIADVHARIQREHTQIRDLCA